MMPGAEAEKRPYDPFGLTKAWPHGDYALIETGVLELNRLMPQAERDRLYAAIAKAMRGAPTEFIERELRHFEKADPAYPKGVRAALK